MMLLYRDGKAATSDSSRLSIDPIYRYYGHSIPTNPELIIYNYPLLCVLMLHEIVISVEYSLRITTR